MPQSMGTFRVQSDPIESPYPSQVYRTMTDKQRKDRYDAVKRWRAKNPGKEAAYMRRYKLFRRSEAYTRFFPIICAHYDGKCLACHLSFSSVVEACADHVVPLSKGGALGLENVQPLCRKCNTRKRGMVIDYRPDKGAWCAQLVANDPFAVVGYKLRSHGKIDTPELAPIPIL